MCGVLVEYVFSSNDLTDLDDFKNLLVLSKHRGPDSTIVNRGNNYQLGFNRLAILDLSDKGNQPKLSPTKRYHVVFNGEIYNYKELEDAFGLKNLDSTSDTEVLVHLLDKLGPEETLKSLNGMFAIAIVDIIANCLYCARDFAGIKPLFFGLSEQGVVAASQFDQIFKHGWFKGNLVFRKGVVKDYFGFGYMQAPNTIYRNIFQVKPGQYLKITKDCNISFHNFKHFGGERAALKFDEETIIEPLGEVLKNAVKIQLKSDVPLATFLSGGVDSPLITAFAKQQKMDIEAFTIAVDDKEMDESLSAKKYAQHIKVKHVIEEFKEDDLLSLVDEHFEYFSEPFGDYSSIPTYLITKKARQKQTVMLSGDGGDELFFGYPRMLDILNKKNWFEIPFLIRRPLIRLCNKFKLTNSWAPYNYRTLNELIKEKQTHIFKDELNEFFANCDFSEELNALYDSKKFDNKTQLLEFLRENEFYGHMQRVLIKVDRMSMANSLEVRVPFLDKQVVETAFKFHPSKFNEVMDLKRPLKVIMKQLYSDNLYNEQKRGFTVPIERWLKNPLKRDVERVVFETPFYGSELLNVTSIRKYVAEFFCEKHDSAWGVWHIYAWQKWAISQGFV